MRFDPTRRRLIKCGAITALTLVTGAPASAFSNSYSLRLAQAVSARGQLGSLYYLHFHAPGLNSAEAERWREALIQEFKLEAIAGESVLGVPGSGVLRGLRFRDGTQLDMRYGVTQSEEPMVLTLRGKLAVATFTI